MSLIADCEQDVFIAGEIILDYETPIPEEYDVFYQEEGQIAIFTKKHLNAQSIFLSPYVVAIQIEDTRIVGIYSKNGEKNIREELKIVSNLITEKTIVAGDFNAVDDSTDRTIGKLLSRDKTYAKWLKKSSLYDLYIEKGNGPFWTYKRKDSKSRIDHILGTKKILEITNEVDNTKLENHLVKSDHTALAWTDLSHYTNRKKSCLRFPDYLLNNPDFVQKLKTRIKKTQYMPYEEAVQNWWIFIHRWMKDYPPTDNSTIITIKLIDLSWSKLQRKDSIL